MQKETFFRLCLLFAKKGEKKESQQVVAVCDEVFVTSASEVVVRGSLPTTAPIISGKTTVFAVALSFLLLPHSQS